ncbi:hypothetical protein [Dyadobacter sp. 676]|uniref:VCBS repeat-containing protein n=1 Tax=Dyadobacter sp. 676 TaxID=3088362 RepID=A0AAU8FIC1_9BACT
MLSITIKTSPGWHGIFIGISLLLAASPAYSLLAKPKPVRYEKVALTRYQDSCVLRASRLKIVITEASEELFITISENGQAPKRFVERYSMLRFSPDSALLADINGDDRQDIKLMFRVEGASPLAAMVRRKLYLISVGSTGYSKISFMDFSHEPEYDFNDDGNFEIVGKELVTYQDHSYWKYELYSLSQGKLVNCSLRYGYPRLVRFLKNGKGGPAHVPALIRKISREPREFNQQF